MAWKMAHYLENKLLSFIFCRFQLSSKLCEGSKMSVCVGETFTQGRGASGRELRRRKQVGQAANQKWWPEKNTTPTERQAWLLVERGEQVRELMKHCRGRMRLISLMFDDNFLPCFPHSDIFLEPWATQWRCTLEISGQQNKILICTADN